MVSLLHARAGRAPGLARLCADDPQPSLPTTFVGYITRVRDLPGRRCPDRFPPTGKPHRLDVLPHRPCKSMGVLLSGVRLLCAGHTARDPAWGRMDGLDRRLDSGHRVATDVLLTP